MAKGILCISASWQALGKGKGQGKEKERRETKVSCVQLNKWPILLSASWPRTLLFMSEWGAMRYGLVA